MRTIGEPWCRARGHPVVIGGALAARSAWDRGTQRNSHPVHHYVTATRSGSRLVERRVVQESGRGAPGATVRARIPSVARSAVSEMIGNPIRPRYTSASADQS